MNKWLFHQNGFIRTSLSATVTRVSNFVEENVCVMCFYIVKAPRPGEFRDRVGQSFPTASLHRNHSILCVGMTEKSVPHRYPCEIRVTNTR